MGPIVSQTCTHVEVLLTERQVWPVVEIENCNCDAIIVFFLPSDMLMIVFFLAPDMLIKQRKVRRCMSMRLPAEIVYHCNITSGLECTCHLRLFWNWQSADDNQGCCFLSRVQRKAMPCFTPLCAKVPC